MRRIIANPRPLHRCDRPASSQDGTAVATYKGINELLAARRASHSTTCAGAWLKSVGALLRNLRGYWRDYRWSSAWRPQRGNTGVDTRNNRTSASGRQGEGSLLRSGIDFARYGQCSLFDLSVLAVRANSRIGSTRLVCRSHCSSLQDLAESETLAGIAPPSSAYERRCRRRRTPLGGRRV